MQKFAFAWNSHALEPEVKSTRVTILLIILYRYYRRLSAWSHVTVVDNPTHG